MWAVELIVIHTNKCDGYVTESKSKHKQKKPQKKNEKVMKKQKPSGISLHDSKQLESLLFGILQKFNVIPKNEKPRLQTKYGEGTSGFKAKKTPYKRKQVVKDIGESDDPKDKDYTPEEDSDDDFQAPKTTRKTEKAGEGKGANPETVEIQSTILVTETTKQEESNKKSEVGILEAAIVEGEILKENSKTEAPEKEMGQEELSQPKYAYLPTPTTKQGYIECLELRLEHIAEEIEQFEVMIKKAISLYPNDKEILQFRNEILCLFPKSEDGKQTTANEDAGKGHLVPPMVISEKNSYDSKNQKKVFNTSDIPSFDLGIEDEIPCPPRSPYEKEEVNVRADLTETEKDVSTFIHCFVDAPT